MPLVEVYYAPEVIKYKTFLFSKALIFQFIFTASIFVAAFLSAFHSYEFWNQTLNGFKQGKTSFQYNFITNIITSSKVYAWSSYPEYNTLNDNQMTNIPSVIAWEDDYNQDGIFDRLNFNLIFNPSSSESILGIKILLLFQYELDGYSILVMNGLGLVDYSTSLPGSALYYVADLLLQQNEPLPGKGVITTYNTTLIPSGSSSQDNYDIGKIMSFYSQRNTTLQLHEIYPIWIPKPSTDGKFTANITINYPSQQIIYTAPFWYMLKWAYIQYVAVLFIFLSAINRVKQHIFVRRIFSTIEEKPTMKSE